MNAIMGDDDRRLVLDFIGDFEDEGLDVDEEGDRLDEEDRVNIEFCNLAKHLEQDIEVFYEYNRFLQGTNFLEKVHMRARGMESSAEYDDEDAEYDDEDNYDDDGQRDEENSGEDNGRND